MRIVFDISWKYIRWVLVVSILMVITAFLGAGCIWVNNLFFNAPLTAGILDIDTILQDMLKHIPHFGVIIEQLFDWMSVNEITLSAGFETSSLLTGLSSSIVLLVCVKVLLFLNQFLGKIFGVGRIGRNFINFPACIFGIFLAFWVNDFVENCFSRIPSTLAYIILIPLYCVPAFILALLFSKNRGSLEKNMLHWLAELLLDGLLLLMIYMCVICFYILPYIDLLSAEGTIGVLVGMILSILGITILTAMKFSDTSFSDTAI